MENWHDTVKEMTSLTVNRMHEVATREGKVNVLDWWAFMAMDIVGRLMYGRSFGNVERGSVSLRSLQHDVQMGGSLTLTPDERIHAGDHAQD